MVKFLIIRFSSIGDIVLTTPVIRLLKTQVNGAVVHFLTKKRYHSLLKTNPHIDRIHLFDDDLKAIIRELKDEGFDYIIDLQRNPRSSIIKTRLKRFYFTVNKLNFRKWLLVNLRINQMPDLHIVDRNLKTIEVFDCKDDGKGLDYFIPADEEIDTGSLGKAYSNGYIALAIGAQHETKKMPVEELTTLIRKINLPVIILGGPEDKKVSDAIIEALPDSQIYNGSGAFSVNQSASIVNQAKLVITHDTGMMHIGAAFHKKVISIWGSTVPAFGMFPYLADPESKQFEVQGLSCRPCSKLGKMKCPKGHFKCMMEQDLEEIAASARGLFNS